MERLIKRYSILQQALQTLQDALSMHETASKNSEVTFDEYSHDQILLSLQDSLIQRFEYALELFWKYLKLYLEVVEEIEVPLMSPKRIIRACCEMKLISEDETKKIFDMIQKRNYTSRIYKQEVAEIVVRFYTSIF